MPYATELLSGNGARGIRFAIYSLIQIIATLSLLGMSQAVRTGLLLPTAPESARHPDRAPYFAWVLVFVVSVPVAFATAWAYAIWPLMPTVTWELHRLLDRSGNSRHPESSGLRAQEFTGKFATKTNQKPRCFVLLVREGSKFRLLCELVVRFSAHLARGSGLRSSARSGGGEPSHGAGPGGTV